ncbi:MAG: KamA family radical SAM protein [Verrucomicrobiae bacterium]|nr:KamA family radical SAM protein [Verrucomicrobiae bacterium]
MNPDDPGGPARGLARFRPAPRTDWPEITDAQWNDWHWQLQHRFVSLADLEPRIRLTPAERAGILFSAQKLSLGITPHFFSLVDKEDPACPIRRQVLPVIDESHTDGVEMGDPVGEESSSPVPGLVHRYPDRVLLMVTDRCASYCRYCTRSRLVSGAGGYDFHPDLDHALAYLREHPEVRDVLLSGGDPLLLGDDKLDRLLGALRAIPHLEFLRIGSRIPIFLPQRVTPALCAVLRKHHPIWMSVHVNHPRELTVEVREALGRLSDAGIPLGNQSVLLAGVNDSVEVMRELVHKLLLCRVRPYYLYQCDLIRGSRHLRAPVTRGIEIIEGLRGFTSGYAVPQFVVDAPGGGGKVPINPEYVIYRDAERIVFRNFQGRVFEYPDPAKSGASRPVAEPAYEVTQTPS